MEDKAYRKPSSSSLTQPSSDEEKGPIPSVAPTEDLFHLLKADFQKF